MLDNLFTVCSKRKAERGENYTKESVWTVWKFDRLKGSTVYEVSMVSPELKRSPIRSTLSMSTNFISLLSPTITTQEIYSSACSPLFSYFKSYINFFPFLLKLLGLEQHLVGHKQFAHY